MSEIYLGLAPDGRVLIQHHQPFHPKYGLEKTREELEVEGIFVTELPTLPEALPPLSAAVLYYKHETSELSYHIVSRPESLEEKSERLLAELETFQGELEQSEAENASLLLELVSKGVL
ncbi:hypothetical protein [Paenibacillus chungangensis]|uniref:Uncharacterized protein n=1 Tax=Paenibacillus chungangensis TaxID=696535 RepID=A0ABW3HQP2_9BACL